MVVIDRSCGDVYGNKKKYVIGEVRGLVLEGRGYRRLHFLAQRVCHVPPVVHAMAPLHTSLNGHEITCQPCHGTEDASHKNIYTISRHAD